ncbi:UDP-glycosyltransferase UGT5-like [Lycorma delicatula]|uniref:UDP-glycosyltransferase UGT5-like n=1 Tax=Lycorma delicatula TaxID=130591 RepID=UPI003F5194E0
MKFIFQSCLIICNLSSIFGANILAFMSLPFKSHIISYMPLFKELALRGHNVTFYTAISYNEKIPNLKEIVIENFLDDFIESTLKNNREAVNGWKHIFFIWKMGIFSNERLFEKPEIQELIQSTNLMYDVVLLETFFCHEPFVALGYKFNAPVVNLHPFRAEEWISNILRNPQPLSYVPNFRVRITDKMNFYERAVNMALSVAQIISGHLYYIPKQDRLMRKHFKYSGLDTLPPLLQLLKNTSLSLLDGNPTLTFSSPQLLNFIHVGGIHILPNKKLPNNLEKWIDDSADGIIYFSFGSMVKISNLDPEILNIFLNVLSKLPQRILWKWEKDENIPGQSSNIKTSKWFPQRDILAHPKCRAFITHGGFHSVLEAAYYGVPIIGVPVFVDQESNLLLAEKKGFGQLLKFEDLTTNSLFSALYKVLNEPSFKENAEKLSTILQDVPSTPLETAVYWVEYVIRHKGALHLKPTGVYLPWYEYYMCDVILVVVLVFGFVIYVLYMTIKVMFKKIFDVFKSKEDISDIKLKKKN